MLSFSVHFGLLPFSWFYFNEYRLLRIPPEIWRCVTTFLISGPKIGLLFDPYFGKTPLRTPCSLLSYEMLTGVPSLVFQYLSQIETASPRFPRREDVVWYLVCVCTIILVSTALGSKPMLPCSLYSVIFIICLSLPLLYTRPSNICPHSASVSQL